MHRAFIHKRERDMRHQDIRLFRIREQIVYLSDEEDAFVALESRRLLRARRQEAKRKKRLGIPPPPAPGKIAYAVYM